MHPTAVGLPLVGRESELEVLGQNLSLALEGRSRFCLIAAEAGMGKTSLARWISERAREQGATVLWGRCWEGLDSPAYWPWIQVVKQALERLEAAGREELIGTARGSLSLIAPEIVDGSTSPGRGAARIEDLEAFTDLFKRAALADPIVLILEDVHAADESSKLLLRYLAGEMFDARFLIVATFDPTADESSVASTFQMADLEREVSVLRPSGLDETAIARVYESLEGSQGDPATISGLRDATEGNPLFVIEAIQMLRAKGELRRPDNSSGFRVPRTVGDTLRRRLSGLPDEVLAVLKIASVAGREFDTDLVARVADLDPEAVVSLLDSAVEARAIEEADAVGRFRFSHVLLREAVYEDLSPGNRMRTHRLVAEALEERATDSEERTAQLAHHWFKAAQAGDYEKALGYLERAAQGAAAKGAPEEATRFYSRALRIAELVAAPPDRVASLEAALLEARVGTGMVQQEGDHLRQRFEREGEYWTLEFQGTTSRLKGSKGLGYLAQLLAEPGREFHVLDLTGSRGAAGPVATPEDGLTSDGLGDAGEVLDPEAKRAYRARITELREEIEEATSFNDPERAARHQEELDALLQQLSGAVGLGGRDRKAASVSERARSSVTKTIKDALKKISESDPALGSHLVSTVRTGTYCSYKPDPRVGVRWNE